MSELTQKEKSIVRRGVSDSWVVTVVHFMKSFGLLLLDQEWELINFEFCWLLFHWEVFCMDLQMII